jgi:hypothetical protein
LSLHLGADGIKEVLGIPSTAPSDLGQRHFYELEEEQRRRLTLAALAERRTLVERWLSSPNEPTDAWNIRAAFAVEMLKGVTSVVDVGCHNMRLERLLGPEVRYIPVDVVARDERTIVVDLNREPMPKVEAQALLALGLLTYLYDVPKFLGEVAAGYSTAVLSYNTTDDQPPGFDRRQHAWVSDYSGEELEAIFQRCGLRIVESRRFDVGDPQGRFRQRLWKLARAEGPL